jgi:flagellar transcriptional activator FlhC
MRNKSVVTEAKEINLAVELVQLGARLQVLEAETSLSRERLLRLYKEVRGESPPKGMLPFSTDWFMSWQPNIHSSLFIDIHRYLTGQCGVTGTEAIIKAYRLYLEHVQVHGLEQVLSLTRAWSLVRFIEARMLTTVPCAECGGRFVVHTMDLHRDYVCGMCNLPSRAGKTRKNRARAAPAPARPAAAPAKAAEGCELDAAFARLGGTARQLRKAA